MQYQVGFAKPDSSTRHVQKIQGANNVLSRMFRLAQANEAGRGVCERRVS